MSIGIIGGDDGPTTIFVTSSMKQEAFLFLIIVSLLLIHEMDAIRAKEWRLFPFLKDMAEETAYWVFTAIHLPLYLVALYFITCGSAISNYVTKIVIDVFLLAHAILHYCFRKKENNGFHSRYSKMIIYFLALLALAHLSILLLL